MTEESSEAGAGQLAQVVHRNIRALLESREKAARQMTPSTRAAEAVRLFVGSVASVIIHALFFGGWILINSGVLSGIRPFDPFPYVMLAMIASVEAIFLTSFVLLSQNRMQEIADRQAELDLQISLLAEHEVTRLVQMTDAICRHLGIPSDENLEELKQDVRPEVVLHEIERAQAHSHEERPSA